MRTALIIISLCMVGQLAAAPGIPDIQVIQDQGSSITLAFELQGYNVEPVFIDGSTYSRITVPGQITFLEKGMPELPTICRNIIIPDNAVMSYRIVSVDYETRQTDPILPSKGNLYRNVNPDDIPYTFDQFYNSDRLWPANTIELGQPFVLRDYRGINIRWNPFSYNPATGELRIARSVVVEVFQTGIGGANILNRSSSIITREFMGIYENTFLNFQHARYDSISERAGRMVIICADAYMSNMEDFKIWKRMKGIDTKLVSVSSIGNTPTSIKNFIQTEYDAGDLVWVHLVGDGNEVEPAIGTVGAASGYAADPVYAYTSGTDYYPDIFVSRFSSNGGSATNIDKQVSRSIGYEKMPDLGADWYHVGLGIASAQGSPADSTRCNYLRDSLLAYTYTEVNKSYDYWGTSTMIKGFIEDGTSIINYIGHGSTTGWSNGGGFSISNINTLDNPWMLPFALSVACVVGNFDGSACYCEASMVAGTVAEPDGFIAHWGSTINQSWDPPCVGQAGANAVLTQDLKNTIGGMCFSGACYMVEYYGGGATGVEMAQTWVIFGDASLQFRSDTPASMTVNHAGIMNVGQSSFAVSVPGVQHALVGLYIDTLLVGHGYTDGSGNVTLDLNPVPMTTGTMYITVTAYNRTTYLGSVPIITPTGPYIVMATTIFDDAGGNGQINPGESVELGVWAQNVGVSTAYGVFGLLSESDPYVSITEDSSWYGNISVDDSTLSSPYYTFTVANDCPNNYAVSLDLDFFDNSATNWTAYPAFVVYAPILTYQSVQVVGGNGNGILDPDETADLVVTLKNDGGATADNVTSTIIDVSSTYVTVDDASGNYGSIDPGATADNSSDPYTVTADASTPTGTQVQFTVEVEAGVYTDTFAFSIVVGKKHYFIWNPDPTPTPGQNMHSILAGLGYTGDYSESALAADLTMYQAVIVCVGIFSNNYEVGDGSAEALALEDYLQNQDGRMYLEGGDVWYYDPIYGGYDFCPLFGINAADDGDGDMGPVVGESGAFTTGMNFNYGGENSWMDHINPSGSGFLIFHDGDNNYNCGVANNAGTYQTVGTSFELGLLTDASGVSTRAVLIDSIMKFFGIITPGVEEQPGHAGLPMVTKMHALYPNPVSARTLVTYQIAERTNVSLTVYDAAGRMVRTLHRGMTEPGYYTRVWDMQDDQGRSVASGIYFVRFQTDTYQNVDKAVLLK